MACDETTRVVGASPSAAQTATTAGPPTSAATTAAPTATAARTTTPPGPTATSTASATTAPPTASSSPARTTAASPTPPPATGAATLGSCADEATARPGTPGPAVPVVFSNQSGATLDYLSLDASGRRVLARSLSTGSYTQQAHIGDVWIASRGGTCVALYRVTAAALLISSATRQSLIPLYAIAGIITDARTGAALSGQTVFIWQPEESACSIIGGSESPGYVVSSTTGPDGTYQVYVSPGDYKIRVRATAGHASQWWSGKSAITAGDCAAADVVTVTGDTFQVNFRLPPQ